MAKHKDSNIDNPLTAEHDAMDEAEAVNPHQLDEADTEDATLLSIEKGAEANDVLPAEVAAIHTDTEAAHEASGMLEEVISNKSKVTSKVTSQKVPARNATHNVAGGKPNSDTADKKSVRAPVKPKLRSGRYQEHVAKVDARRAYPLTEAVDLAKQTAYGKFDASLDIHVRLSPPRGKKDAGERFRTVVVLPHGTGKEPKIGVLDEALIEQIKQRGDTDFDILLASPALMPKVAQIAKILGPKGKMPNPKIGTVTDQSDEAKRAILSGRIEMRADAQHILHQAIGRVSWPTEKLVQNLEALFASLPRHRLQTGTLAATMGPGIRINLP
ncbi:50S ribosomal protein L1 [Candidatus Berkelbacteria bacterium]|nr:50S ribosomal protein L1 [Candidatus Berkelbacteria bacterium]